MTLMSNDGGLLDPEVRGTAIKLVTGVPPKGEQE